MYPSLMQLLQYDWLRAIALQIDHPHVLSSDCYTVLCLILNKTLLKLQLYYGTVSK